MRLGLGLGLNVASSMQGVGVSQITAPTIAVVNPVTNPPSFDMGLGSGLGAPFDTAAGDFIELRIDGTTTYTSSALSAGDIVAGTINIANGTLTNTLHTADARVKRTAGAGFIYSAYSSIISYTPPATVPVNSVAPAVTGNAFVGQTLTTDNGTWSNTPTSYTYQWKRGGSNIGGATASTYVLVAADASASITCAVTASNAGGAGSPATSNSVTISALPTASYIGTGTLTHAAAVLTKVGAGIGTASASRRVVVAVGGNLTSGSISSATVGGVAATIHCDVRETGGSWTAIISAVVPTGTTGDIVITMSATTFHDASYAVYTTDNSQLSSTTPHTATNTQASGTSVAETVSAFASGFMISSAGFASGSSKTPHTISDDKSDTWTVDLTTATSSGNLMAGHSNGVVGGSTGVTDGWTGTFAGAGAVAGWL